jgi:hypothetical protein
VRNVNSRSHQESAEASVIPISPLVRKNPEPPDLCNEVMGVDDEEEEVEEGRVPRTRKFPESMSAEELRAHSLTHIPYHPGCKCCVAGRKRDHKHPRRDIGQSKMQADLEAANGASLCADYFFPRDKPGDKSLTAIAICDTTSQFLAGHVVDSKGAGAEHAVRQVLRDLRKMGHYGQLRV